MHQQCSDFSLLLYLQLLLLLKIVISLVIEMLIVYKSLYLYSIESHFLKYVFEENPHFIQFLRKSIKKITS